MGQQSAGMPTHVGQQPPDGPYWVQPPSDDGIPCTGHTHPSPCRKAVRTSYSYIPECGNADLVWGMGPLQHCPTRVDSKLPHHVSTDVGVHNPHDKAPHVTKSAGYTPAAPCMHPVMTLSPHPICPQQYHHHTHSAPPPTHIHAARRMVHLASRASGPAPASPVPPPPSWSPRAGGPWCS